MNIKDKSALRECTSCQMCAAVCSHNAININLNEDGFYRPYVNADKCTDCGLCTKVCYKFDTDVKVTSAEELNKLVVRSAQNNSDALLKKVTSGGVADTLAKELVKLGYVCIGVAYNDANHRAEHVIATTEAETDAFRGSKYIQSYSYDAFKYLAKNARTTKFAIFGLPCHIYAAHQFLTQRKLRDDSILIDLFCHGCPSMLIWNKYEKRIKEQNGNKKFDDVQFRSKVKGWGAFHVTVDIEGKKTFISSPKQDEFYSLFFSDYVLNDACADCKLRSTMGYTDIRLGDFWGKRFQSDKKGGSAVAIATDRGLQLFNSIKEQLKTEDATMWEVANERQSYGKNYSIDIGLRNQMLNSLRDNNQTLKDTLAIYENKQGIGYKIKKIIKQIDWYMPFDIIRFLKRFA